MPAMKRKFGIQCVDAPPRKVQVIRMSLPDRMLFSTNDTDTCPADLTLKILADNGIKLTMPSYSDTKDFFQPPTQAEIDAYDFPVINAIRAEDIPALKSFHKQGRPLKCSNKFGESILHMACRKGMLGVTTYLVKEAGVPLTVCDDYGRNPLHDACWRKNADFALIDLILEECPDLLYIRDRRGNTPLHYVRREEWGRWGQYLNSKSVDSLTPKRVQYSNASCGSRAA